MLLNQYTKVVGHITRKDGYQLLSRMRNWARDVTQPVRDGPMSSSAKEFQDALSVLEEAASNSRFAAQRRFSFEESRWFGRIRLELNLKELPNTTAVAISRDAEVKDQSIPQGPAMDEAAELEEKRKLIKAEQALRRLLAIQEC